MAVTSISARALEHLIGDWRDAGSTSTYLALANRIRLLILDGRIPSGSRVPAERELSTRLELSRSTIAAAYAELRSSGYLHSVRGSGSVARIPGSPAGSAPVGSRPFGSDPTDTVWNASEPLLNFTEASLPAIAGVAEAMSLAASDAASHLATTGYSPVGLPELREAIADRYAQRGLPTSPDQILVTFGALHAITLLARTLLQRGDRAIVETPTYPHAMDALANAGARLVPVSVTAGEGWDAEGMLRAFSRTGPTLAYLMPDFHNPTGESMSNDLRQRIVDTATKEGAVVIADETTGELDIDRSGSFLPMAAFGDAILVGSASKTLWGGLRVGWIRASPAQIRRLIETRAASDLGTPVFEQLVVARLMRTMPSLLALRRNQLQDGRDFLRTALAEAIPDWSVPNPHGGMCLWVNVGKPVSSNLTLATRSQGVVVNAGPRFGRDGAFERYLRLPTTYSEAETTRAVEALRRAWTSVDTARATEQFELQADMV